MSDGNKNFLIEESKFTHLESYDNDSECNIKKFRKEYLAQQHPLQIKLMQNFYHINHLQVEPVKLKFSKNLENSKQLCIFDINTSKIEELELNTNRVEIFNGSKCLLPNGNLFYNSNHDSFIIDQKNNLKRIGTNRNSKFAYTFYHNGFVYLIGGLLGTSWRYKLNENRWSKIASKKLVWTGRQASTLFGNYAFLWYCNSYGGLLLYDIDINSYSFIDIKLDSYLTLFFVSDDSFFIIDNQGYLYESNGILWKWKKVGKSIVKKFNRNIVMSPIYYQEYAYFANFGGIFRFDLKKKKLEIVKDFKEKAIEYI